MLIANVATGLAMTEHNKTLVVYPRGENSSYTLGLVNNTTSEEAYPTLAYNTPSENLYTMIDGVPYGSNSSDALISASSVFITTNGLPPHDTHIYWPPLHLTNVYRRHLGS